MTVHSLPLPRPRAAPEGASPHVVQLFMTRHGAALAQAAGLVAGPREAARARVLAAEVRRATRLDRPLRAELVRLYRLLGLRLDPAHGADLHPADRRVHEICALTDALGDLLDGLAGASVHAGRGEPTPEPAAPPMAEVAAPGAHPRARRRAAR